MRQRITLVALSMTLIGSLLFGTTQLKAAPNGDIDQTALYHSAPDTDPETETVPGQTYTFRSPTTADAPVDVYILTADDDLSSATLLYTTDAVSTEFSLDMKVAADDVSATFRGQPERVYDVWTAEIPVQPEGMEVSYRIQATDALDQGTSDTVFMVAGAGTTATATPNMLGQYIAATDDPENPLYTYVVAAAPSDPTETITPTMTITPTETITPTNTPEPTATNTPEPTATNTPEPTATNNQFLRRRVHQRRLRQLQQRHQHRSRTGHLRQWWKYLKAGSSLSKKAAAITAAAWWWAILDSNQ